MKLVKDKIPPNKFVVNPSPNEIISSRALIEKFYSEINEAPLSPVSKISYPDPDETYKIPNTSNFSLMDNSPQVTQENEIKTLLIKKFEEFLESMKNEDLVSNEHEILKRLTKMNDIRAKTPEISFSEPKYYERKEIETLKRKYENLMIENNELDLEIINFNMKIREVKNHELKGMLEIQRNVNELQSNQEELFSLIDNKKAYLLKTMQEIQQKEKNNKRISVELNDALKTKQIFIKNQENKSNESKFSEIEKKRKKLQEIKENNEKMLLQVKEIEIILKDGFDNNKIKSEIALKEEKIQKIQFFCNEMQNNINDLQSQHNINLGILHNERLALENEEKTNENHQIIHKKYDEPIQKTNEKMQFLQSEIEVTKNIFQERTNESSTKIQAEEKRFTLIKQQKKEFSMNQTKKIDEMKEIKENLLNSLSEKENLIKERKNEIENHESLFEEIKQEFNVQNKNLQEILLNTKRKNKELFSRQQIEMEKKAKIQQDLQNLKNGVQFSFNNYSNLDDLKQKNLLLKALRNELSEEINQMKSAQKEKTLEYNQEIELSKKENEKNNTLDKDIANIKELISNCSKNNEEVCTKFKLQIEENSKIEKELKEYNEVLEKYKLLVENQLNEINNFNEKTLIYKKELEILEKKDLKAWNNYLKEKEKAAKKKKK